MTINSLDYYQKNSQSYFDRTSKLDLSHIYTRFLKYLMPSSYILDAGCGSGRDSVFFLQENYRVYSYDYCDNLCSLARKNFNLKIEQMDHSQISFKNKFDGIWACASLLHLNRDHLSKVIYKFMEALKDNGVFYTSFKIGIGTLKERERLFYNFEKNEALDYFSQFASFCIVEFWESIDVKSNTESHWINIILQKKTYENKK